MSGEGALGEVYSSSCEEVAGFFLLAQMQIPGLIGPHIISITGRATWAVITEMSTTTRHMLPNFWKSTRVHGMRKKEDPAVVTALPMVAQPIDVNAKNVRCIRIDAVSSMVSDNKANGQGDCQVELRSDGIGIVGSSDLTATASAEEYLCAMWSEYVTA